MVGLDSDGEHLLNGETAQDTGRHADVYLVNPHDAELVAAERDDLRVLPPAL